MKKWKRAGIALVLGAALCAVVLGVQTTEAAASKKEWYEGLTVTHPDVTVTPGGDGYLSVDDGESPPTVSESTQSRIKGASVIPSAYMNTLSQLSAKYPSVRDQGDYNTCWAFSAIGLAEFDLITDNQAADSSLDLSEFQLAYFTYHNQADTFGGTAGDALQTSINYLMFGGNLEFASRALLQWQGVVEESLMPYGSNLASSRSYSNYAMDLDVAHLQNTYILNIHTNQSAVKREIMNHGSAGIGLYMSGASYIKQAVYDKTGETVATYYCPKSTTADHALNIVGWDDSFPASAFATKPAGDGAWLVRNSWSTTSENDIYSYFWLSYYDKSLEDEAWIFDFESPDNYDYIYQYDGCSDVHGINSMVMTSANSSIGVTKYANIFQVQGTSNELLKAVSIAVNEDANVAYKIRIYANLSDLSNPKSGLLAETVTGKTTYAGTYTVPLTTAVSLPKGTYYSVVVQLASAGSGIDVETSATYVSDGNYVVSTAHAESNQSFIYYKNAWRDLAQLSGSNRLGIGNLCIKAYTEHAGTSIAQTKSVKTSSVKSTSAKISWAKTTGATGYVVYRSTKKDGTYTKVATVKKLSYTNSKLKKNTTYYYKVRAYKKSGSETIYGKFSGAVKVKTKKK
jgi:C1A family cysteine protease